MKNSFLSENENSLIPRHIGPTESEEHQMLKSIGYSKIDDLIGKAIPKQIQNFEPLQIGKAYTETESLAYLKSIADKNKIFRSFIGMGYYNCTTPTVIQRMILENPGWYTQYTPYQAEISQGRLEALLNFQTMVADLCGLDLANASLLDEGTAAAEAMSMSKAIKGRGRTKYFVANDIHPQSLEVIETRAKNMGIELLVDSPDSFEMTEEFFGALLQYPNTFGEINDPSKWIENVQSKKGLVTVATDLLALTQLKSPGELGADIAIGSSQRFGLGLFYGGPHAAFISTKDSFKRQIPGRIVGVSKDATGKPAARLALQTREQHIRRDKATSNICTAQVLLAVVAGMYAVYHGPKGLRKIGARVAKLTGLAKAILNSKGMDTTETCFDTLLVKNIKAEEVLHLAEKNKMNLRLIDSGSICFSLDEATTKEELLLLLQCFVDIDQNELESFDGAEVSIPTSLKRTSEFMTHENFNSYHTESEFLRYVTHLQSKDLSLAHSMIPLGSCTMKLNATSEMIPISWPEFANIHPFAPLEQTKGYQEMFTELEDMICKITGFDAVSLQPNAGSQGEYAGLLAIKEYHLSRSDDQRNICLIPTSAHGTNPASAVMAGMVVKPVSCDEEGNIDVADLKAKAEEHKNELAALMITYPSTHGVFEEAVKEICDIVHDNGGQVYLDGANLNAQVGLCKPGEYGPDVCHLNLHKTFAIPHGGGGPGMGPIGVKSHLEDFLPGSNTLGVGGEKQMGSISAAPWGSALILNISWSYIRMMGDSGLKRASEISILNANYMAHRLKDHFPILYTGKDQLVAHECIIDCRHFQDEAGVTVADIAKRLMDYGFHAPTMSWPVAGTMMIEPTESENLAELDRFCDALIAIHGEIKEIETKNLDQNNNLLKNAPHTADVLIQDDWDRPYSRQTAAYPLSYLKHRKFWPSVSRVDDAYGDRNLMCSCPSMDEYSS
ncbi:MAG: aminomethyl-transferring glycine dehydrogenase [Bdellovibrionales bacterium]